MCSSHPLASVCSWLARINHCPARIGKHCRLQQPASHSQPANACHRKQVNLSSIAQGGHCAMPMRAQLAAIWQFDSLACADVASPGCVQCCHYKSNAFTVPHCSPGRLEMFASSCQVSWELLFQHVTTNSQTLLTGQHTASPTWSGQHANCTVFNPAGFPKPLPAQPAQHQPPALPAQNPSLAFAGAFVSKPRPPGLQRFQVQTALPPPRILNTRCDAQLFRKHITLLPNPAGLQICDSAPLPLCISKRLRQILDAATRTLFCTVVTYLERLQISPHGFAPHRIFTWPALSRAASWRAQRK